MSEKLYFEDFSAGMTVECGARAVTTEEAIAFAEAYDPQPMHVDPVSAETTLLGGLALSGWQTCGIGQRVLVDGFLGRVACLGSPGVASVRWRRPARPDSPIAGRLHTRTVRPSKSRPEIGFVLVDYTLSQDGEPICIEDFTFIVASRFAGSLGGGPPANGPAEDTPWSDSVSPEALAWGEAGDVPLGQAVDLGEVTLSDEDIIEFARAYDPQAFHLDEAAGAASLFGGLAASGWQLTALWSGRLQAGLRRAMADLPPSRRAAVDGLFGPSPGFSKLVWKRPALAGDRLRFFTKPVAIEPHEKRDDWVVLESVNGAINQTGALVFQFDGRVMMRR